MGEEQAAGRDPAYEPERDASWIAEFAAVCCGGRQADSAEQKRHAVSMMAHYACCEAAELRVLAPLDGAWHLASSWSVDERSPIGVHWWEDPSTWRNAFVARIDDRADALLPPEVRSEMWSAKVRAAAVLRSSDGLGLLHLSWRALHNGAHPLTDPTAVVTLRAALDVLVLTNRWSETELALSEARAHDPLTGLHNRHSFESRLELDLDALRAGAAPALSVVLADVTDLRSINDEYGHRIGDLVLVEFAHRLQALARRTDIVARIGEDEFVIAARVSDLRAANELAAHVDSLVNSPLILSGNVVELELSVAGVYLADAVPLGDVMMAADRAVRSAQRLGPGRADVVSL